jgi:hypothetical protein
MAAESTTIFEFSILHVKPKYMNHMLHALPNGRKILEKHGAKPLGIWLVEAGGFCELYSIAEWPSVEKRIAMRKQLFTDPEIIAHWNNVSKFICTAENFICKANTHVPCKQFTAGRPIWVDRIKPHKSDVFATQKLLELCAKFEKHFAPDIPPVHCILHPLAYPSHCIWAVWELPEGHNADRVANKIADAHRDPKNWAHMEETREAFEVMSSVVATPIPFDHLPPLH